MICASAFPHNFQVFDSDSIVTVIKTKRRISFITSMFVHLPQNSAQLGGDVAISGWMPIGGTEPFPIQSLGYRYPIAANSVSTIPAAPINMGAAVSGNDFYSVWSPDKSKTYGVINGMYIIY